MEHTMKQRPNVALIVETSVVYGRQILHGVSRYLRAHGGWSVYLDERELLAPPPDWLLDWNGDGVICRPTTPALADAFRARGLAVVDLNDRYGGLGFPRHRFRHDRQLAAWPPDICWNEDFAVWRSAVSATSPGLWNA